MRDGQGLKLWLLVSIAVSLFLVGCGAGSLPAGSVAGRAGLYDYSPSAIQTGNTIQLWWCGQGSNPDDSSQNTDSIQYSSTNAETGVSTSPKTVLAETAGAWDSAYTCNPKVIKGSFQNPLGDSKTYTYAMYYVATDRITGNVNSIGVAFSNDGETWAKYPNPVIPSTTQTGYGVAQPSAYNSDGKAGIILFYEDDTPIGHHVEATSTDGIHFTVLGTLTENGLDPSTPNPSWGDIAYDPKTDTWVAGYNRPSRSASLTGDIAEGGQWGIQVYRIASSSLLNGASPWQLVGNIDTNSTGYECNFIPGLLRDPYGNVNVGPYPSLAVYTSISNPPPKWDYSPAWAGSSCRVEKWDIGLTTLPANPGPVALKRYYNGSTYEVTTGWIDPSGGFLLQSTLGHLYALPTNSAPVPLYGCKAGYIDYFVSTDINCEGQRILGVQGYAIPATGSSVGSGVVPLYRCYDGTNHFVSNDAACEGKKTDELLGYALP
ncbi:hypothetical protein [Silvibacterium acidisoli]|uniref:hypothetical protein n=1 Tax=Acidobacteriaceae bacterium ZG23-2 TaxID=2883246 RepID=UPI00406CFFF8